MTFKVGLGRIVQTCLVQLVLIHRLARLLIELLTGIKHKHAAVLDVESKSRLHLKCDALWSWSSR